MYFFVSLAIFPLFTLNWIRRPYLSLLLLDLSGEYSFTILLRLYIYIYSQESIFLPMLVMDRKGRKGLKDRLSKKGKRMNIFVSE